MLFFHTLHFKFSARQPVTPPRISSSTKGVFVLVLVVLIDNGGNKEVVDGWVEEKPD